MAARIHAHAYRAGWRRTSTLCLPSVGIGSPQVGGAGKTPLASWVAGWFQQRGIRPGILLRGYGGDEGLVHRELLPNAVVVEDPDRCRGARTAAASGARVAVLDDNAQHLRVTPDRQILVVNAEAMQGSRALLPAGPWRQPWHAGRGQVLVVTRKSSGEGEAAQVCRELERAYRDVPVAQAELAVRAWRPLLGGPPVPEPALRRSTLFALSGVAHPRPFLQRVARAGHLRLTRTFRDHARYGPARVRRLVRAAESARVDYVVTTAKDAVKLRRLWPVAAPPILIAALALRWESGEDFVTSELEACLPAEWADAGLARAAEPTAAGTA